MNKKAISVIMFLAIICTLSFAMPTVYAVDCLPSGYTQLEYIESQNGAYIDTGEKVTKDDRFELKGLTTQNGSIMGCGTSSSDNSRIQMHFTKKYVIRFFGTVSEEKQYNDVPVTFVIDLKNGEGFIQGEKVISCSEGPFRDDLNIFLFSKNIEGAPDSKYTKDCRIYSYQHYRNDKLIRNMVPCRRNSDRAVGMYDTVFGIFYENANSTGRFFGPGEKIDIFGTNCIVMNADTGEIYYGKNEFSQHSMASMTKILECILVIENLDLNGRTVKAISSDLVSGTTMGLTLGESLPLMEALYGFMLPSGNDAGQLLARTLAGSYDACVEMMNEKAAEIGCTNTHIESPYGHYTPGHYTTAYDWAKVAEYAMQNEIFRTVVSTKYHTIPADEFGAKKHELTNTNQLLGTYDGIVGIKTGTNTGSGACLASKAVRNGTSILAILMGSDEAHRYIDSPQLLDYGFKAASEQPYTVTASGNVLTIVNPATGYTVKATITAPDEDYTGEPIENAVVETVYSSGTWNPYWDITYKNNVEDGIATASISYGGKTASTKFRIRRDFGDITYKIDIPNETYSVNDTFEATVTASSDNAKLGYIKMNVSVPTGLELTDVTTPLTGYTKAFNSTTNSVALLQMGATPVTADEDGVVVAKLKFKVTNEAVDGQPVTVTLSKGTYIFANDEEELDAVIVSDTVTLKNDHKWEYISAKDYMALEEDTKVAILKTDKRASGTYALDGQDMFWSEKYEGYAYIVADSETDETLDAKLTESANTVVEIAYNGDVDSNGKISGSDALETSAALFQLIVNYDITVRMRLEMDVNGDKSVTAQDITYIMRVIVGLPGEVKVS